METFKFHKSECGVEVLLNVLSGNQVKDRYIDTDVYNTDYFEVIFFKSASGFLRSNGHIIEVSDNSVIFVSTLQRRQWQLVDNNLDFTVLVFQEDFLNDFFADKLFTFRLLYFYQTESQAHIKTTLETISRYCQLLTEIKQELTGSRPDSEHIIRSILYYLLQTLNRTYAQQQGLRLDKAENNFAYQFKRLLESNILKKQRINDYAQMMGISRITLNTAVKSQFNITAVQLLKQRLTAEIKDLILHSDASIADVADRVGFSEPNHLMRFFKTQTGMTIGHFVDAYTTRNNNLSS